MTGLACPPEENGDIVDSAPRRSREAVFVDRLQIAAGALADDLRTTVALYRGRGAGLRLIASAIRDVSLPPVGIVREMAREAVPVERGASSGTASGAGTPWTFVRMAAGRNSTVLALHGAQPVPRNEAIATAMSAIAAILTDRDAVRASRCQTATHALSRRLAHVYGFPRMANLVSSATAKLLGARLASTAIFDPITQVLKVHGTFGYPSLLVEHARITPGEGIIGSVFQSGLPLCVPDVRAHDDLFRSRPRYRSHSFVAVPVRAGQRILGVISATDREDDRPFTREDVSSLRVLAAPVALALARELAVSEAEQYAHAAAIDPLSGLFNRRYLHVRLEEELERARRHQIPLALLMIDLDDFKMVNDKYGHLAGDSVIKEVAVILRRTVRMFDVCTRYGGEEFAILMPNSGAQSAATVAERIRRRIESYRFSEPALAPLTVTASIGLAVSTTQLLPRDLIDRADQALYQAKSLGKNRVWFG